MPGPILTNRGGRLVRYVPIDQIIVSTDRQRRSFDPAAITTLANSIASRGLLHPLTVRNASTELVAGERRLRAIAELAGKGVQITCGGLAVPSGCVPVLALGDLDALALEETELEENIIRADLSWQERANAEARLHALRSKQAAEVGEKQTLRATASELHNVPHNLATGDKIENLRESILLNDFMNDPDVASAGSRKEALNIVKRKVAAEFRSALAERYDNTVSDNVALLGDARTLLAGLHEPDGFDLIITDPPYGIEAHKMTCLSGSEAGTQHAYDDTLENARGVWYSILTEGFRLCKPDAVLYMFCDFRHWDALVTLASEAGWTPWPTPLIWHKPSGGMLGDVQHGPRKSYETIMLAHKGDMRTTGCYLDVITMNPSGSDLHAAAKPPALYVELLKRYALPGMRVLDPCMGSGPVFPAANVLHLVATGIEVIEQHFQTALSRISDKE